MRRRLFIALLLICFLTVQASAATIRWVDFPVPFDALKYAMDTDISTAEQEIHIGWIETLAMAACRTGGKCPLSSVKKAVQDRKSGKSPEELLGTLYQYYDYYHEAYTAVLGGLLGSIR